MPTTAPAYKPPRFLFLRKFLRESGRVAAIVPSSRQLSGALCRHVDGSKPQTIVEVGGGTGAATTIALDRMHAESRIVSIEIDPQFAEVLAERCPRATVLCADVRDLPARLDELGIDRIDLLISCLALPKVPRSVNEAMFDCYARRASRDATFTQLTLVPWVYKRMYHRLFDDVTFELAPRNLPPGGAYHCRGLRGNYRDHLPGLT